MTGPSLSGPTTGDTFSNGRAFDKIKHEHEQDLQLLYMSDMEPEVLRDKLMTLSLRWPLLEVNSNAAWT